MENSNTPWTPGPWVAEEADFFGDHNIILADSAGDSSAIAAVVSNLRPALEVANNARLIAAAPDLLDSLSEIFDYAGGADSALHDEYVMDRARAAIAKAEGK